MDLLGWRKNAADSATEMITPQQEASLDKRQIKRVVDGLGVLLFAHQSE